MEPEKLSNAIDLSHHLSDVAQARAFSPLKVLQKYFGKPGVISLAGGKSSSQPYFPRYTHCLSFQVSQAPVIFQNPSSLSWLWNLFSSKEKTASFRVPRYPINPGDINLAESLQYSLASGIPTLQKFVHDFTKRVYKPRYANYATLVHTGNTDGWAKAVLTLCNPGEAILVEEWTYPSAVAMTTPHNIKPVAVPLDGHGVVGDAMRRLLSQWDENARGMPRPHVFYTVPVGQNPTGSTMQAARKQEIYNICVEFDVIIVEDDPYYFLQQAAYLSPPQRTRDYYAVPEDDDEFVAQLVPTYLSFDYQGRVIRLDTFSKTVAPGSRLGWFTCNPVFAERLERQSEATTQAPCGFSQAIVAKLVEEWQFAGYFRWLKGLRIQYQQRRDFLVDCIHEQFTVRVSMDDTVFGASRGLPVYVASSKLPKSSALGKRTSHPVFSFTPPSAGMFLWINLVFENHPSFGAIGQETLEMKLWVALAEAGVLFAPDQKQDTSSQLNDIRKAIATFSSVLNDFYATLYH
ncbi:hypothetical protein H0H92_000882 [Tricholoma furcatifolium]|nr:hypothetical protein H0H92_000882 [Tricholoma furcatifolium]